jgi:hypothetical protein
MHKWSVGNITTCLWHRTACLSHHRMWPYKPTPVSKSGSKVWGLWPQILHDITLCYFFVLMSRYSGSQNWVSKQELWRLILTWCFVWNGTRPKLSATERKTWTVTPIIWQADKAFLAQWVDATESGISFHVTEAVSNQYSTNGHNLLRRPRQKIQINQPIRCKNFSSLLLEVYVQLNMFRASSRPSSGAQQLQ